MVKRTAPDQEPEESSFELPSVGEHLFQVVDYTQDATDENIYRVKLEIVGGEDEGKTILNRVNIDDQEKSFWYARLFLKAIGEPYKGEFDVEPERWIGRQFYATIKINGKYANLDEYNFDKKIEQQYKAPVAENKDQDIQW